MSELNWYVGMDWGGQSHQVCVVGGDGEVRGQNAFAHSGPGHSQRRTTPCADETTTRCAACAARRRSPNSPAAIES